MPWGKRSIFACLCLLIGFTSLSAAQWKYNVTSYNLNNRPVQFVTGDFDRDGRPDFIVTSDTATAPLELMRNNGNGTFTRRDLKLVPGWFLATADINGDGKLDLVTPNGSYQNSVSLKTYLGNGDGTFHRGPDIVLGMRPQAVVPGDFNNDGIIDLAVLACMNANCQVMLLVGNGDATYRTSSVEPLGSYAYTMVATDFNADGKLDIAVGVKTPSRAVVYFGDGTGGFSSSTAIVVNNPVDPNQNAEVAPSVAIADFNDDGAPDLVIVAGVTCGSACGTSRGFVELNDGHGHFTLKSEMHAAGTGGGIAVPFDFNNDGIQDIRFFNSDHYGGGDHLMQGNGDGTFKNVTTNFYEGDIAQYVPRDLNLDSRHDVIGASWSSDSVEVGVNANATMNCPPPASDALRAKICSPANNATAGSRTFQIRAAGNSPAGVRRLELWIDGHKSYQTWNDQMRHSVTFTAGKHRIVVVAVDQYIGSAKATNYINVP